MIELEESKIKAPNLCEVKMETDTQLAIPSDASDNKCFLCQNNLTVPPIMTVSSEIEQYICGRCKEVKYSTFARNTIFENVARFLSFPCTYEKCTEIIPWERIELHEQICSHRTVRCPVFYQECGELIEVTKLEEHFREKHIFNLKTGDECWTLNTNFHYVHLWVIDNLQFFVYVLHFDGFCSTGVLSIDPLQKYKKYNVMLTALNGEECFIVYENQKIFHYDERHHCYKCIRRQCQTMYHPYSQENKKLEIDLKAFTNQINKVLLTTISTNDGDIKYTITLIADPNLKNKEK